MLMRSLACMFYLLYSYSIFILIIFMPFSVEQSCTFVLIIFSLKTRRRGIVLYSDKKCLSNLYLQAGGKL